MLCLDDSSLIGAQLLSLDVDDFDNFTDYVHNLIFNLQFLVLLLLHTQRAQVSLEK